MRLSHPVAALSAVSALALFALTVPAGHAFAQKAKTEKAPSSTVEVPIKTATGEDAGTASFSEGSKGVNLTIVLKLKNLPPGDHAVHIHQNPVCDAPAFTTAGGHLNPDGKQHGMDNPMGHHAGDLPQNITISADGTGTITYKVKYLTLKPDDPTSVLGHAIMVHEKADDMKTDPTGNAGARIACGVIPKPAM